jgi:hypothetical protein
MENARAVGNPRAVFAFVVALLALAALAAGAAAAYFLEEVELEGFVAVPAAIVLALLALSLSRRARRVYDRTLGRAGGRVPARIAQALAVLALLAAVTAALAFGIFALLVFLEAR